MPSACLTCQDYRCRSLNILKLNLKKHQYIIRLKQFPIVFYVSGSPLVCAFFGEYRNMRPEKDLVMFYVHCRIIGEKAEAFLRIFC